MERKFSLLLIISAGLITLFFAVMMLATPDIIYDEIENRNLARLSPDDFLSDGLAQKVDAYFTDQFPFRREMVDFYTKLLIFEKKGYVRNLIVSGDWLLPRDYPLGRYNMLNAAGTVNRLADDIAPKSLYFICVPTKSYTFDYMLPSGAESYNQKVGEFAAMLSEDIAFVDAAEGIYRLSRPEREGMFFKTDYHWNGRGAFFAFGLLMDEMEHRGDIPEGAFSPENYTERVVSDRLYNGDLNRRLGYLFSRKEDIIYLDYAGELPLTITLMTDGKMNVISQAELFASELNNASLDYNGAYTMNWPYFKIVSPNAASGKKALILKDSMQNPTTLNFASVFTETEVIDVRFLKGVTAREIIGRSDADVVIIFYNSLNLSGEMFDFGD